MTLATSRFPHQNRVLIFISLRLSQSLLPLPLHLILQLSSLNISLVAVVIIIIIIILFTVIIIILRGVSIVVIVRTNWALAPSHANKATKSATLCFKSNNIDGVIAIDVIYSHEIIYIANAMTAIANIDRHAIFSRRRSNCGGIGHSGCIGIDSQSELKQVDHLRWQYTITSINTYIGSCSSSSSLS